MILIDGILEGTERIAIQGLKKANKVLTKKLKKMERTVPKKITKSFNSFVDYLEKHEQERNQLYHDTLTEEYIEEDQEEYEEYEEEE